ncbi:hypothetical protein Tco_0982303 [Tanacetum coccineum]
MICAISSLHLGGSGLFLRVPLTETSSLYPFVENQVGIKKDTLELSKAFAEYQNSNSTEALGFESKFSIPSSTIILLKVGSSRGLHSHSLSVLLGQDLNVLDTEDQEYNLGLLAVRKEKVLLVLKVWILRKIHLDHSLSSFITIAKGGSSSIFTFFNLLVGAELVLEAEELLLPLAGAEERSFIMIPCKVSALNVDFEFKINLIVFSSETVLAPVSFSSGGRGCYRLKTHPLNHNQSLKSQRQQLNGQLSFFVTHLRVPYQYHDLTE